tara:strand:- start:258 stop:512 length:255 start_codon:yes stop_codon:yes gene_type:complete
MLLLFLNNSFFSENILLLIISFWILDEFIQFLISMLNEANESIRINPLKYKLIFLFIIEIEIHRKNKIKKEGINIVLEKMPLPQ